MIGYKTNTDRLVENLYKKCLFTNSTNSLTVIDIIPLNLITNKQMSYLKFHNKILITKNLINKFKNYEITIYPDPVCIKEINGRKIGIFKLINGEKNTGELCIESKYFIRWHYDKYCEKNKINYNNFNNYISEFINKIDSISSYNYHNVIESDGDYLMYPS